MRQSGVIFILTQIISFLCIPATTEVWPYCNNFAFAKGYPLGCKTSPYDLCTIQNDDCKELVCDKNEMKDVFRACGDKCNDNPDEISIPIEDDVVCWCLKETEKICNSKPNPNPSPFGNDYSFQRDVAFYSQRNSPHKDKNVWGAAVELPGGYLMPVFCYDEKKECPGVTPSFCQVRMCPQNTCSFENNCYYVEKYTGDVSSSCKLGKPAAIETQEERQFIFFLLTEQRIANMENPIIATAGLISAFTRNLVWNGWEFPVDNDVVTGLNIIPKPIDQILYVTKATDLPMNWGLEIKTTDQINAVLCKTSLGDSEELCDTTTTTTENGGGQTKPTEKSTGTDPSTTTPYGNFTTEEITTTPDPETTTFIDTTDSSTTEDISEPPTVQPPCSGKCIKSDQYGELWSCCDHTTCSHKCPLEANGSAFWSCGASQYRTKWPIYDDCSNSWVTNLTTMIEEERVTSYTLIIDLDQFIKDSSLFGHELYSALNFTRVSLHLLINEQNEAEDSPSTKLYQRKYLSEMALKVIDKLLALSKPWEQIREWQRIDLGNQIQAVSEMFGFSVARKAYENGQVFNMSCEWVQTHMESQYLQRKYGPQSSNVIKFPMVDNPMKSSIIISEMPNKPGKFEDVEDIFSVGTHLPMKSAEMMFPAALNNFQDLKKRLNAGMVSMTLYGPKKQEHHKFLSKKAVTVIFKHERQAKGPSYRTIRHELYPGEKPTAIKETGRCVFWNRSLGNDGQWDTSGCQIINSSHWYTVCECNHLSSFALLMDVHDYIAKDRIMEIVSIVFSSLSVISLALTLFVLHGLKGIQGERNSIGKHLCLCLMTGHLMALTVLDRSYFQLSQEVCIGVAVTLHYVFLAAFMWMAVEGHHLYRLVVRVFDSGRDLSRIYLFAGYGTPVLVVAITCTVTAVQQDSGYANDELCWLSSPTYIWAFMGPVLFLTLLNLIVLVLAMRVAVTAAGQQKKSFMERVKTWIRGWFSLSALLGVTWIFGFFYIQWDHNFAYAFITLNGCQGIFIFLTRVVFNEQVKTALRRGAKQRAMMKRFYSLAWKNRSSGSSFHPSSWFFGTSSSSQLDLTSSASTSYWGNTASRRRSSANHSTNDGYNDTQTEIQNGQNFPTNVALAGHQDAGKNSAWLKRICSKDEENCEPSFSTLTNCNEIQQIWNNLREPDTLSEIPEEDYDEDGYVNFDDKRGNYKY